MSGEREWTWSWHAELTWTGRTGYGLVCATREEAAAEADLSYMTVVSRPVGATEWECTIASEF